MQMNCANFVRCAGKPVATAELPDGSLLLSDDTANAIYRITYTAPAAPAPVSTVG